MMETLSIDAQRAAAETVQSHELRDVPLFNGLPDEELARIAAYVTRRRVVRRDTLFTQDQICDLVFVLERGAIKLIRENRTVQRIVDVVEPGEVFGVAGLFSGNGYTVSAEAAEPSEVLAVQSAPFLRLLQGRPMVSWQLLACLGVRMSRMAKHIEELTSYTAEQRVAAYLLRRANTAGGGAEHPWPRQTDIANLLGVAPETLCRIMKEFRRQKRIVVDEEGILVGEPQSLAALL